MMRTLGTIILLSASAFAQTSTTVQTAAAPTTVSVQPATNKAQAGKPSPNGAKATASVAPKAKTAVSAKATSTAKPATPTKNAVSVKPVVSTREAVSVKAAATKPASAGSTVKAVSAQASAIKPVTVGSKAVPAGKSTPLVGVLAKPAVVAVTKGTSQPNSFSVKSTASTKPAVAHVVTKPVNVKVAAVRPVARTKAAAHSKVAVAKPTTPKEAPSVEEGKPAAENKQARAEFHTAGRRDPFLSPVVTMGATGSGCSAGKRCLTIDQIALKGVVKAESGMIAVVTNSLDKAYFLRENDPVFNGYVVKITGDSIIFKESFRDRLGKTLTRDVTKSITRPVA